MRPVKPAVRHEALFDDLPPRRKGPLGVRWWAVAIVAHALLLALPVGWYAARTAALPELELEVRLQTAPTPLPWRAPAQDAPVLEELPELRPEPRPAPSPEQIAEPEQARAAVTAPPPAVLVREPDRPEPESLDTRRLLEAVARMEWGAPEAVLPLSRPADDSELERLYAPLLPEWSNSLDGMAAPSKVEITDRWMSPGGDHNVVIRAPDGNTYCGRQKPVDDLRPWLQMPMMFRPCGGGGKRGGAAGWRNN